MTTSFVNSIYRQLFLAAVGLALATAAEPSRGQDASIYRRASLAQQLAPGPRDAETLPQPLSWTHVPLPAVRQLRIHDRILVRVDELSRVQAEGDMQSRKTSQYDAVLKDWIQLIGLKAIKPSPQVDGDQRIAGDLQQIFRAQADMETRESLALNITCTVADIRPNGDVVLEGHKQIQINHESWAVSLSGICRYQDIGPDNTVLSRQIADLNIVKQDRGHVRDSYKRGWLSRWIDEWTPF